MVGMANRWPFDDATTGPSGCSRPRLNSRMIFPSLETVRSLLSPLHTSPASVSRETKCHPAQKSPDSVGRLFCSLHAGPAGPALTDPLIAAQNPGRTANSLVGCEAG